MSTLVISSLRLVFLDYGSYSIYLLGFGGIVCAAGVKAFVGAVKVVVLVVGSGVV